MVAVLGSCITRDNFNRRFNPTYRDFYRCELTQNQASLISLMSDGFNLPEDQYGDLNEHEQWTVRTDLDKEVLPKLAELQPDYLILDFFADVHFGILTLPDGRLITNNRWKLPRTDFYRDLKARGEVRPLRFTDDRERYLELWQEALERFATFVAENLPDTTVIVHRGHFTDRLKLPDQPTPVSLPDHRKRRRVDVERANRFWRELDRRAAATFDAEVIDLTDRTYTTFDDHPWGPFYVHYTMDYYHRFLIDLHRIHLRRGAASDRVLRRRLQRAIRKGPQRSATAPAPLPRTLRAKRAIRRGLGRVPVLDRGLRVVSRIRRGRR